MNKRMNECERCLIQTDKMVQREERIDLCSDSSGLDSLSITNRSLS